MLAPSIAFLVVLAGLTASPLMAQGPGTLEASAVGCAHIHLAGAPCSEACRLEREYLALHREAKRLNHAFYELGTMISTYASRRRPNKRLLKLDERILTLHAHILLRDRAPARIRKQLCALQREFVRWRVETEVRVEPVF